MKYLTYLHELSIDELSGRKRVIRVFVPDIKNQKFSVLYMHDGQNIVDPAFYSGYSWDVLTTISRLVDEEKIEPLIVVGIDSEGDCRIEEYSESLSAHSKKYVNHELPKAEAKPFSSFIVNQVLPFVESTYPTKSEKRGIAGSSCGGNLSYYMGATYPNVFEIVGAFSPAYHIVKPSFFNTIHEWKLGEKQRIYHDMGMKETKCFSLPYLFPLWKTNRILKKKCQNPSRIKMVIDPKGRHTELCWQARFDTFILWAYQNKM